MALEALELATSEDSPDGVAAARVVLAQLFEHRGEREAADAELDQAAEIYRHLGSKTELADVLMRLSRAAKARNDLVASEHFATQAFEATRAISVLPEVKK